MEQPASNGAAHRAAEQPAADDHQGLGQSFSPPLSPSIGDKRIRRDLLRCKLVGEVAEINTEKSFAREKSFIQ